MWHIPDFPNGIASYSFDGPTFIPVDFKDYHDNVKNIEVWIDGQPTDYAEYMPYVYNGQTNWGMGVYFDRISNGTHQIQLVTSLELSDQVDDPVSLALSNIVRSIVVDNQVTFTNWDDTVWNNTNYTFRATTKSLGTSWSIDIYDAWGDWINGASGTTSDGHVQWTWDLRDYNGNLRNDIDADPFFDPWITFNTTLGAAEEGGPQPAAQTSRPMPIATISYPALGAWLISYMVTFYDFGTPRHDYMVQCMQALAGWVDFKNVPVSPQPLAYGTNDFTQTERDDDWHTTLSLLADPDYRNFYYFGHGNPDNIGGDFNTYSNNTVTGSGFTSKSKAYLSSKMVKDKVTQNKQTGHHPYRFVWLDGCSTAAGSWPDAFGINKATNNLAYYSSTNNPSHRRPCAFVGWSVKVGGAGWGTAQDYFLARSQWAEEWTYNSATESLIDALEAGRNDSNWVPSGTFWSAIRVYGYTALRMNEYNQKTDWPGP